MTGHMDKAKCRIVAQGFTQRYGVDFTETYATTPKLSTMRLFMKKALQLKMRRCEWDIKAAYLHSLLEESIFMKPPYGAAAAASADRASAAAGTGAGGAAAAASAWSW